MNPNSNINFYQNIYVNLTIRFIKFYIKNWLILSLGALLGLLIGVVTWHEAKTSYVSRVQIILARNPYIDNNSTLIEDQGSYVLRMSNSGILPESIKENCSNPDLGISFSFRVPKGTSDLAEYIVVGPNESGVFQCAKIIFDETKKFHGEIISPYKNKSTNRLKFYTEKLSKLNAQLAEAKDSQNQIKSLGLYLSLSDKITNAEYAIDGIKGIMDLAEIATDRLLYPISVQKQQNNFSKYLWIILFGVGGMFSALLIIVVRNHKRYPKKINFE